MPAQPILHIRQDDPRDGVYPIRLTLRRAGRADLSAEAAVPFALTPQEHAELRWYLEDYLQRAETVEPEVVAQVEALMDAIGVDLYNALLTANPNTQALWFAVREQLADLRVEITTGIAEAAAIPWELLRDPQADSPLALRVAAFVRVQSNPNIDFVQPSPSADGRVRLLYVVCRPGGSSDVGLRAVANRLLHDLGPELARFEITALRPPTFERLQSELTDAKAAGRPYQIVHFDGHGLYDDLSGSSLAAWLTHLSPLLLGGQSRGKHGYLLFEHPTSPDGMRPVSGGELGKLLHDTGVPLLVLNACQSAMHEATERPTGGATGAENVHDEVRAIGSLAQAVVDQGIPAVLGMRYSVFVVTAAQYIGELYAGLAKGWGFGQAAGEARKHLQRNPERWVGLHPHPLQDWFVPVVYEALPLHLLPAAAPLALGGQTELDPVQANPALLRYVPDTGFVGRDETLLLLDRAFDAHPVVLLHAYAGQGKSSTAVEFARWYAQTGGLGPDPRVLFTSFETHTELADVLAQVGQAFAPTLQANGIEWHALNDPAQRRGLVLQLLRLTPVLWIWDNVEPVAGFPAGTESQWTAPEQAELADFLKLLKTDRATRIKLLLTSRRDEQGWLGGIPHRVAMPRMSRADAARLAQRLGAERNLSRAEIAAWQPLLDYCAGNPLTLRVIVGQAVKMGLRGEKQIAAFAQAVRDGETAIADVDAAQGRDKSLAASLDYGFRHAFAADELPVIALLHLFQGTVDVDALEYMGRAGEHALAEVQRRTQAQISSLLDRATEIGLLTHLGSTYYIIHPALPWFLGQLFAYYYDGQAGRSSAQSAQWAWVGAVGASGDYNHNQFAAGNHATIHLLTLEEANLLHARRLARRNGWWWHVIEVMQGLRALYIYQGRRKEWAGLVAEIVPDYCSADDAPISGRENAYSIIMSYRVDQAMQYSWNLVLAGHLQEKQIAWARQQAADALSLPIDAPLDAAQQNHIRSLATDLGTLGRILSEQGNPNFVAAFEETVQHSQRIADSFIEAITHFNLGTAYMQISDNRYLDAAETAFRHSLELRMSDDALGRSICIFQIGNVYHKRFTETRQRNLPHATQLSHAQVAISHYRQALALYPTDAINELGLMYNKLGNLYYDLGQTESARESYEKAIDYCEKSGNRYGTANIRENMATMYTLSARQEESPARRRDLLRRGLAYAQAAARDFKSLQGGATDRETKVEGLIDAIDELLRIGG